MKRSELYASLWAEPATKVAARYSCTSTWIKRLCNVYNIPTPPQGYWASRHAGRAVQQPPLPDGEDVEINIGTGHAEAPAASLTSPSNRDEEIAGAAPQDQTLKRSKKPGNGTSPRHEGTPRARDDLAASSDSSARLSNPTGKEVDAARAATLAHEYALQWQRDQQTRGFLVQVAGYASTMTPDAEVALLSWVSSVERGLDAIDPIRLLVKRLGVRRN